MSVASKSELIEYCLRKLGKPVIDINVTAEQCDDRVNEALQFWSEYHSDSMVRKYAKVELSSTDIANGYVDVDSNIISVTRVLRKTPGSDGWAGEAMFSPSYQFYFQQMDSISSLSGLVDYEMHKSHLSMIDRILSGGVSEINFSRHQSRVLLNVKEDQVAFTAGEWLVFEVYQSLDPSEFPAVWNDMILKRYATALIKMQWGSNLSKFEGVQLPGGVTLNGLEIFNSAREEIQRIEEEIQLKYEEPLGFFTG